MYLLDLVGVFFLFSPKCPGQMDWSTLFPEFFQTPKEKEKHEDPADGMTHPNVEFADIGCGYGGLLGVK